MKHLKTRLASCIRLGIVAFALLPLLACAGLSPEERDARRAELDAMGEKTVATLLETQQQLREVFDNSLGYVVLDMKVTKIPVFGAGSGFGVVVDKRTNSRSYLQVSRFEVGGGIGAQRFKVVIVFQDGTLLDRAASGAWHYKSGVEVAVGTAGGKGRATKPDKGYQAFKLVESGAVAAVTVRVARAKPYLD